MPATLLQLRTAVRANLDETVERFWLETQLNIWINAGCRDIARRSETIQNFNTTINVSPLAFKLALPSDVLRVHRVEYQPTGQTQIYTLQASTDQEMDQVWGINQTQTGIYPQFYTIWGIPGGAGTAQFLIKLYPLPSQSGILNLYYYGTPTTMVADGDTAQIPEGWQDLLPLYCEYEARRKDRDPLWSDVKAIYEEKVTQLVDTTRQWHDQASTVSVGMSNVPSWLYSFDA